MHGFLKTKRLGLKIRKEYRLEKGLEMILTPFIFCGTPGWVRTSGFQLRRLTLYPLSYGRITAYRLQKSKIKLAET